jgi:predicted nucleic acid-binding Zn ribbon protein
MNESSDTSDTSDTLKPLADHVAAVYRHQQWDTLWILYTLLRQWPDLVGPAFAAHSTPAYFRKNDLWVYVTHSIWMQQMHLAKVDILSKINARLDQPLVQDLRWTLVPADFVHPAPKVAPQVLPTKSIPPETEQNFLLLVEHIADPEARRALWRLWRCCQGLQVH